MYYVRLRETPGAQALTIHTPFVDGAKLVSGNINQGINSITSFDFEIDYTNEGYRHIKPMQTIIEVTNIKNNRLEFIGRVVNYADSMSSDGLHTKSVICEGGFGYLHDSNQPYTDFSGYAGDLFRLLIANHNAQVEDYKKFKTGAIYLDVNPWVTAFLTPEDSTFDALKSNLLDVVGGEINVYNTPDSLIIEYVQQIGYDSQEDIGLSRNLKSITKKVDPSNIVTRLIPLGKTIATDVTTDNERRTTIESVNNGVNYLERADLVSAFGIQYGSNIWDEVTDANTLKNNGIDWLNKQKVVLQQFTVEAIDLFKIGKGIEEFYVGNTHKVVNPIMAINERIRVVSKKVDIVDPINSSLTIGDKFKSLIDYQREQVEASKNYTKLQNTITQQRATIASLSASLNDVQTTVTNASVDTLPSDLQTINTKLDQIQADVNALPNYALTKFVATIGDGVSTTYTITHNLGTRDVMVNIRGTTAPYSQEQVMNIDYGINTIVITTASPISTSNTLSVTIIG
jgi:hypothetical protein